MNVVVGRDLRASVFGLARWTRCWREILPLLCATLSLLSCYPDPRPALKGRIAGDWEEVHGTREVLHFSQDGSLIMESPREHHQCAYDFPDAKHIRLNCAPAGSPASPEVWRMSFTDDDKLLIGNATETGTYKRK
jgi:hypothetical protein